MLIKVSVSKDGAHGRQKKRAVKKKQRTCSIMVKIDEAADKYHGQLVAIGAYRLHFQSRNSLNWFLENRKKDDQIKPFLTEVLSQKVNQNVRQKKLYLTNQGQNCPSKAIQRRKNYLRLLIFTYNLSEIAFLFEKVCPHPTLPTMQTLRH